MLGIPEDRTDRHLFAARIVALVGTGLAAVAPGLRADDLARQDAAMVLGAVLVAHLGIAPLVGALGARWPRRASPADDPQVRPHGHDELPPGDPHLGDGWGHAHPFVIDDLHRTWPEPPLRTPPPAGA